VPAPALRFTAFVMFKFGDQQVPDGVPMSYCGSDIASTAGPVVGQPTGGKKESIEEKAHKRGLFQETKIFIIDIVQILGTGQHASDITWDTVVPPLSRTYHPIFLSRP
jgi:hypothetical protein